MRKFLFLLGFTILAWGCSSTSPVTEKNRGNSHQLESRDYFTSAMFHELNNDHEKALIDYYLALLYDSTSFVILNRIAENHMALGRYDSAIKYLENSLKLNSNNLATFRLAAKCQYKLKNDPKAIEYFEKILVQDPYDSDARNLLILLYRKTGNMLGLARQYEILIDLYGHDEGLIQKATAIYLQNGDSESARKLYLSYLKSDSTNAEIWYNLSRLYEIDGDHEEAIHGYLKSAELAPSFNESFERLHVLYRQENQWDRLITDLQPFLDQDSSNSIVRFAIAEAFYYKKDFPAARRFLGNLEQDPHFKWQSYDLLGRIELEQNNYEEAQFYFQQLIDFDPNNRIGWLFLGFVYSDMDSLSRAENHYKKALERLPDDPFLLAFYGMTLSQQDKNQAAIEQLEKSLELNPKNSSALISYAVTLNKLSRKQDAIRALEKTLEIDKSNINAISTLATIYDELDMHGKSDSIYQEALNSFPEDDLLMNNFAYSLAERNIRLDYALELVTRALEAEPENGAYLDTMGWILYQRGEFARALEYIKKSIEQRPRSPVVLEHLGDVFFKLGDITNAKFYWNKSLEIDPENINLKSKIEQN